MWLRQAGVVVRATFHVLSWEWAMRRVFLLVLVVGLCVVMIGAALAVLPPGGSFTDDNGNIHEASIEAIAAEEITKGCNPPINDRYCPSNSVTRGQMAAFLVRALNLTDRLNDPFFDDDESIFEADIERLAAAGITRGCNPPINDRYCPDSRVTRGQMAAFLVRALGYTDAGSGDLFVDDDGSVFEADIDRLGTAGVTKGCNPPTNDRYCPDSPVLRDQMASFLTRALKLKPISPPPPISTTTTSGGTTGTTLPEFGPSATFKACDTATIGNEFSLDQRCVAATVYNSTWAQAAWPNVISARWLDPGGNPVSICPVSGSCSAADFHYIGGFLMGWTFKFYVDGENRDPGWHSLEMWAGTSGEELQRLLLRDNFKLSAIAPVPTTTSTTTTTTTLPNVSWSCTVNPDGSRDCSGNTDTLDPAVETWTCTPSGDPTGEDPVAWTCSGDIDKRPSGSGVETWACDSELGDSVCEGNVDTSDSADESWSVDLYGLDTHFEAEGNIDKSDSEDETWECDESDTGMSCSASVFPSDPWEWTCSGAFGSDWSCSGTVGRLAPIVGPVPTQDSEYSWWW